MSAKPTWPVEVVSVGPSSAGTALWRFAGQLNVTVVVKATFALVADSVADLTDPVPLRTGDEYDPAKPVGSLLGVRETVPQLRQAEVLLFGHVYSPPDTPVVAQRKVRLAVGRGDSALVDKTLLVFGDRRAGGEPIPFTKMPLCLERASGGSSTADNPLGVGWGPDSDRLPNIVCPEDPTGAVGQFGPIPAPFPRRKQLLTGCARESLDARIAEIPAGFDWSYFQSAPTDQRIDALHGDEWIELEGLVPSRDGLRTTLPGARAMARVFGHEQAGVPEAVPLRADLLTIEPDHGRCSVVYRGSFPVHSEHLLEAVTIVGAVEMPGQAVSWPEAAEVRRQPGLGRSRCEQAAEPVGAPQSWSDAVLVEAPGEAREQLPVDRTVALNPADVAAHAGDPASRPAPFELAPAGSPPTQPRQPGSPPGAPWSDEPVQQVPLPEPGQVTTRAIPPEEVEAATARVSAAFRERLRGQPTSSQDAEAPPPSSTAVSSAEPHPSPPDPERVTQSAPIPPRAPAPSAMPEGSAAAPSASLDEHRAEPLGALPLEPTATGTEDAKRVGKTAPKVPQMPKRQNPTARMYSSLGGAIKKK